MAKNIEAPPDLQIAALQQQKKAAGMINLMAPGDGTPWEMRGSEGAIAGFFKTALQSLLQPAKLLWSIRRPETTGDATGFLLLCGVFWGLSWIIHDYLYLVLHLEDALANDPRRPELEYPVYYFGMLIAGALCPLWAWLMIKFQIPLYQKLLAMEFEKTRAKPQDTLFYNVLAYLQAPALLSIIPLAGPPLALLWMFINTNIALVKRMRTSVAGAVIAVILVFIATAAVAVGLYFLLDFIWYKLPTGGAVKVDEWAEYDY
jgi:hypothetical protein